MSNKKPLVKIPQYKILAALLFIAFFSNAIRGNASFGIDQFVKIFKLMCIFAFVLMIVKSPGKLKTTLFVIILCSSFIAIQALVQFFSGSAGIAGQGFYHNEDGVRTKWVGLWNGANVMALMFNVAVPFAFEFACGPYNFIFRFINFLLMAALIGGIYSTNSRGGFLTLLITLFLYPMFRVKSKKIAIILGVFLGMITIVCLAPSRMGEINTQEESAHIRTRLWNNGMEMFKDNPLLGVGKGRFTAENDRGMMAHSNFIQNIGETGGIGIFLWIALIYFSFKGLFLVSKLKFNDTSQENTYKSLVRAIMISLIAFNFSTLFVTMELDIFYLLLGLAAVVMNMINQDIQPFNMKFSYKDARNVIGILFVLLLYYHYYTR
jgi:O-antigen ligase